MPFKRKLQQTEQEAIDHEPWHPPPAFWDRLSSIPLTRGAIKELERRFAAQPQEDHPPSPPRPEKRIRRSTRLSKTEDQIEPLSCPPQFARFGGPDQSDLRGFPNPFDVTTYRMAPRTRRGRGNRAPSTPKRGRSQQASTARAAQQAKPKGKTNTTRSTGPYDAAVLQHLVDHNILPNRYKYPDGTRPPLPENLEQIRGRLALPRSSLSPSRCTDSHFEEFAQADADASKEQQVLKNVVPIIEGPISDHKAQSGGIQFSNLKVLTDETLCRGNPDIYYGARPEQIKPEIRVKIGDLIIPTTEHDLPIAPNFMLHLKGPDGSMKVAYKQAIYDGALGARGIQALQRFPFEDKEVYDGNAYCVTSVYHEGILRMYTSHMAPPKEDGEPPRFVTSEIDVKPLTPNANAFRAGIAAYRNLRDWAQLKRDEAIKIANGGTTVPRQNTNELASQQIDSVQLPAGDLSQEDSYSGTQTNAMQSFPSTAITEPLNSQEDTRAEPVGSSKRRRAPPKSTRSKRGKRK